MKLAFEDKLNVLLSELLNQIGVISKAEFLEKGRKDIVVYHQGLAIVLEGSYFKEDAEKDARKRIEQLSADVAIAIHYPQTFSQALSEYEIKEKLRKSILDVKVVVPEDISGTLFELLEKKTIVAKSLETWHALDLNGLASLIYEVGQFLISEESVKKAEVNVSELIQAFVNFLSSHSESSTIAKNLYDILYKLYGFSIGDPVGIKEAIFAQSSLAILLSSIYYESIRYAHKLDSLNSLTKSNEPQQALEIATSNILAIDYEPIFEATEEMLKALPSMPRLFTGLIRLASEIASKKTLLRRDLAGKIYHKVVGDWSLRKGLATFFTQIPAAYLLLYLAKPTLSRVGDFACGSGTLLVAAYSAANAQHRMDLLQMGIDKDPEGIEREFHTQFIQSCYGFDVLEYATQITALNLAFHSPETPLHEFCIYALPLGYRQEDDITSLGSLELAKIKGELWHRLSEVTKIGIREKEKRLLDELRGIEPLDLIAMNPPFARTTGRGGKAGGGLFGFVSEEKARKRVLKEYEQLRSEIREKLLEKASKLLKNIGLEFLVTDKEFQPYTSIWQGGEGLPFLYLADARLKQEGKLCFVLPRGLLSGTSWFLARILLASEYDVQHVIVSYDSSGGYNFSESTSLSECLLVAKKAKSGTDTQHTNFVILLKKPATSVEAIALAKNLEGKDDSYVEAGNACAFLVKVKRDELIRNVDNWGRFVFLPNLELLEQIKNLLDGVIRIGNIEGQIPLARLNNIIASIGVDRHRFTDTFKLVEGSIPSSLKILHGGAEELRRIMRTTSNAFVLPIIERGKSLYKEKAGRVLVPNRIRVDTAHVISLLSEEPMLCNIFYALRLKRENNEKLKALCLWFNTSWGILTALANREETEGGWIELNQSHWRLMPVLNIGKLPKEKLNSLAALFDSFEDRELARIPQQFGVDGSVDQLRLELDLSFLDIMGVKSSSSDLISLYSEIASSLVQWLKR